MKDLGPTKSDKKPHPKSYSPHLVCIPYIPITFFQLFQNLDATFDKTRRFLIRISSQKLKSYHIDVICFWYHHLFLTDWNLMNCSKSLPSIRTS